jgi:UDP-N-acetylmuramoylalanine--D-glutamate ligase
MNHAEYFKGKKITLMGLGLLGRGVGDARFLAKPGADLIVTDLKAEEQLQTSVKELRQFSNITFHLGGHRDEDFKDRDLIIKAAGVPLDSPFIAEAKKNRIPVRMSADLFAELANIPTVGITGTRGKSTTTHLIAHILKTAGKKVIMGGNVRGLSTLEQLDVATADSIAVLELDSWQLQGFGEANISPQIAIFTTFYPDHMNYYKSDPPDSRASMQKYFADKALIFRNQTESDTLILGEQVAPYIKEYGYQNKIKAQTVVVGAKDLPKKVVLKIPGEHNRGNAALAAAAARALGIDDDVIAEALQTFESIVGRLQFLRKIDDVKIYNDNNSTTPEATLAALRALGSERRNIVLIMGGSEKNLDMRELIEEVKKTCKAAVLLPGAGTDRVFPDIPKELSDGLIYQSMQETVAAAFAKAEAGDIILLSPAFASFGLFKNEYDRNDQFVTAIEALK